jgi:hypothetical protein
MPTEYARWKRCITVTCGLALTRTFVAERLAELRDLRHPRTQRFVESWGDAHRVRVIGFFERAQRDVERSPARP